MIIIDLSEMQVKMRFGKLEPQITSLFKTSDSSYEQIFRAGDTREPTHRIIYPAECQVAHCPECLRKALLKYGVKQLVLHEFGHINLNNEMMDNRDDLVTALYWGHFGESGLCYECMGVPENERPID